MGTTLMFMIVIAIVCGINQYAMTVNTNIRRDLDKMLNWMRRQDIKIKKSDNPPLIGAMVEDVYIPVISSYHHDLEKIEIHNVLFYLWVFVAVIVTLSGQSVVLFGAVTLQTILFAVISSYTASNVVNIFGMQRRWDNADMFCAATTEIVRACENPNSIVHSMLMTGTKGEKR